MKLLVPHEDVEILKPVVEEKGVVQRKQPMNVKGDELPAALHRRWVCFIAWSTPKPLIILPLYAIRVDSSTR